MSKGKQGYRNRGFRRLLTTLYAMGGSLWNSVFNRNQRNTGRAGGHLDTSYYGGGGHSRNTNASQGSAFRTKEQLIKIKKRRAKRKSIRINRRRAAGMCSFK